MQNLNIPVIKAELVSFLYVNGAKSLTQLATAIELSEDQIFNVITKYPDLFKLHPMPSGKTIFVQLILENTAIGNTVKEELEKLKQAKKNQTPNKKTIPCNNCQNYHDLWINCPCECHQTKNSTKE